jgi:hypothetical protein
MDESICVDLSKKGDAASGGVSRRCSSWNTADGLDIAALVKRYLGRDISEQVAPLSYCPAIASPAIARR